MYKLLRRAHSRLQTPVVAIELMSARRSIVIPIHRLSQSGFFYHLTGTENVSDVGLFGRFCPRLRFDSGNVKIQSLLTDRIDPLNSFAKVSWWQAFTIRRIISVRYSTALIILENGIKTYIRLCSEDCDCHNNVAFQN